MNSANPTPGSAMISRTPSAIRRWPFALSTKPPIMTAAMHDSIVSHSDMLNDETEPSASPIMKKYSAINAITASIATSTRKKVTLGE